MQLFPNTKTFISILGVDIAWYAVIILCGAALALYFTMRDGKRYNISSAHIEDIFFGTLLVGVLGARLWYVLFSPQLSAYLSNPMLIVAFRDGGLAIQGGLVFGAAYAYYKCKKLNIDFLNLADAAFPNVLIAQAIGRWGNFVNQEAFGEIVTAKHFQFFPEWFKEYMYIDGYYRQPMFFYESILNIVGFILIKFVLPKFRKMQKGDYVFAYLVWYGLVRIVIEHFRTDSLVFFGMKSAQVTSIVFIVIGLLGFMGKFRKKDNESNTIVLFDFDGTLGDTNQLIVDSFVQVFAEVQPDLVVTEEMKLSFVGPTLYHSFERYASESEDVDYNVKRYKEINLVMQQERLEEIEGAKALLTVLKSKGYKLGVVSSKMLHSLRFGLDLLKLESDLDIIIGGDEVSIPKPDPQGLLKAQAEILPDAKYKYYIGDTPTDVLAAQAAGFTSIAICTSPALENDIMACNPDYLIYELNEVLTIIEENENGKI